jgi:L-fuconolactonase
LRLDAHQFFTPEHLPEHLASILARNRFDGSIALARTSQETAGLLDLALRHDYIRGVIACPESLDDLDAFQRHPKFVGVWGQSLDFATLAARAVPLDVLLPASGVLPLVERYPELRIALVHLGLPDGSDAWYRAIEKLAQSPHVYVKASGLITQFPRPWNAACVRPFVQHALSVFGPQRVMFGSDWPACLPDSIWKETLAAFTQSIGAQTMEARESMLGGAACRFYGIENQ